MLVSIHIENFALIEKLDLELSAGFNVLTGETGAGKSIIIDAMGIITGCAGFQDFIRTGEERALVEALFDLTQVAETRDNLSELGFTLEEDNQLVLSREINRNGKNYCRVNGRQVTLSMYREIGQVLVDIYGQHHQQSLLKPEKHITLLDSFGEEQIKQLTGKLTILVAQYSQLQTELEVLQQGEADKVRMLDMYNFQMQEIDQANLKLDEEEILAEERTILTSAEKLSTLARSVYSKLYTGLPSPAVLEIMHGVVRDAKDLAAIDSTMQPVAAQLSDVLFTLEDSAREMGLYAERVNSDPERLASLEDRLDLIKKLKRKYGTTIEEVLKYRTEIAASIEKMTNVEDEINRINLELKKIKDNYDKIAESLSITRKQIAQQVKTEICRELADLQMPHVKFEVYFQERKSLNVNGKDLVEFLISPNPGEPLKPLSKIASGGEVSRIMLALKTILAKVDEIPTLIFDEIDTGLGGRTVQSVAGKLAYIGNDRQVICVTHSPQVASYADAHFKIEKNAIGGRTVTSVTELVDQERIQEVACMLSGQNLTVTTMQNAKEMLAAAKGSKLAVSS